MTAVAFRFPFSLPCFGFPWYKTGHLLILSVFLLVILLIILLVSLLRAAGYIGYVRYIDIISKGIQDLTISFISIFVKMVSFPLKRLQRLPWIL